MRVFWIGVVVAGLVVAAQSPVAAQKQPESKAKKQLTSQVVADVFVCPMHPDVTATKDGKCTKCGMALEKKLQKPSAVKKEARVHKEDVRKEKCGGCQEPCEER